ncbi:MAG: hypothetical protein U0996_07425 [Planctomycetaceae bacterium]
MTNIAAVIDRIRETASSSSVVCDLGDLPFTELPSEIASLRKIELLALGSNAPIVRNNRVVWEPNYRRPSRRGELSLAHLQGLTNLRALDLSGWEIDADSLSVIAKLHRLSHLSLRVPTRAPLAFLKNLTQLSSLELTGIWVEDLSPLSQLNSLRRLHISGDGLTTIDALEPLTGLRKLSMDGGRIRDYRPLRRMQELKTLFLRSDAQSTLDGCQGLTKLESLITVDGSIENLAPLSGLRFLRELYFQYCSSLSDIRAVASMPSLCKLTLENCYRISDWSPLLSCENMEVLRLISCSPRNLSVLSRHPRLQIIRDGDPPG